MLRSSLVYKYQCLDDPSTAYIGKTKRYLHTRANEHLRPSSAIATHMESCINCKNCSNFFQHFKVLEKGNSDFDLIILEALHIIHERPILNEKLMNDRAFYLLNIF